jgi:hypothetical protein
LSEKDFKACNAKRDSEEFIQGQFEGGQTVAELEKTGLRGPLFILFRGGQELCLIF